MIVINGIEMDDGVDEPNELDEAFDDESPLAAAPTCEPISSKPYRCPVCDGTGLVSRGSTFQPDGTSSLDTAEECLYCGGMGIVGK